MSKTKIKAFTLIELLVVMVIFVFLTVIVGSVFLFGYKSLLKFRTDYINVSTVTLYYENLYDDFNSSGNVYFNDGRLIFNNDNKEVIYEFGDVTIKNVQTHSVSGKESEISLLPTVVKKVDYYNNLKGGLISYIELEVTSNSRKYEFNFKKTYDAETLVIWELSNHPIQ